MLSIMDRVRRIQRFLSLLYETLQILQHRTWQSSKIWQELSQSRNLINHKNSAEQTLNFEVAQVTKWRKRKGKITKSIDFCPVLNLHAKKYLKLERPMMHIYSRSSLDIADSCIQKRWTIT